MTALNVGDIFEYHHFDDFFLAFVAKDESISLFRSSTRYRRSHSKLTERELTAIVTHPKFKMLTLAETPDDFKSYYFQHFCTFKKGSKVDFNFRGSIISGVVVRRVTQFLFQAKFTVGSATINITAEPYLFIEKP